MKKRRWWKGLALLLIAAMAVLCGCSSSTQGMQISGTGAEDAAYIAPVVEESRDEVFASSGKAAGEQEKQMLLRQEAGLTEELIAQTRREQSGRYCYELLEEEQQVLYAEVLFILDQELSDILISTNDTDILQLVFQSVYCDHPEIFWIDGYSYTRHTKGSEILYLTFGGKYVYTQSQRRSLQFSVNNYVSTCLAGISRHADEYEKVKYVYEYIIEHTDYVLSAKDNQTILSVFLYGESVCQGYAKAMQYLLDKLGVEAVMVTGRVSSGEGHAWDLVRIDGDYYYVDPTWGDASYQLNGSAVAAGKPSIDYNYLNMTTEQLLMGHVPDNLIPMPECKALRANYYVMENLYFTEYREEHLQTIFETAYEEGKQLVTIKCADDAVYEEMCTHLLEEQYIFSLLHGRPESVVYTLSDENRVLSFWL